MVTFQIQGLLTAYKERFDKDNFIKNLLLDNLLLVDIYNRAKKLHIEVEARRLVFILETNPDKNSGALESVKSLLGTKSGDFITAVDEKNIIIVKELAPGEDYAQMNKVAATILEAAGRDEEENPRCLRYHCQGDQRSIAFLQRSQNGDGRRKNLLR